VTEAAKGDVDTAIVALWFLAYRADRRAEAETQTLYVADDDFLEGHFAYYRDKLNRDVRQVMSDLIRREHLEQYESQFDNSGPLKYLVINKYGRRKLAEEWKHIWDRFELYRYS
jgi:hypothetical protein